MGDVNAPSESEVVNRAAAWMRNVAEGASDLADRKVAGATMRPEQGEVWVSPEILTPTDISLFLHAGPSVLPELITYVRDQRHVEWYLYYPLNSAVWSEPVEVGRVACYLIEAIIRRNPYFTRSGRLLYSAPEGTDEPERNRYALERAADAYEEWYLTCFDEEIRRITCSQQELPHVNWDYDAEAWPTLLRLNGPQWREIFGETVDYPSN